MEIDEQMAKVDAAKGHCQGLCTEHSGVVKVVSVSQWGYFAYCDSAIQEDERRGLVVVVDAI